MEIFGVCCGGGFVVLGNGFLGWWCKERRKERKKKEKKKEKIFGN